MNLYPSLLHHPPPGVNCGILLLFAFPFIALAILRKWPFLPVIFFYTPFFLSLFVALYVLLLTLRGAVRACFFTYGMLGWGVAEALGVIAVGAGSSFMTALFNLRVRRRKMYPVFPITLALTIAAWMGGRTILERLMQ